MTSRTIIVYGLGSLGSCFETVAKDRPLYLGLGPAIGGLGSDDTGKVLWRVHHRPQLQLKTAGIRDVNSGFLLHVSHKLPEWVVWILAPLL